MFRVAGKPRSGTWTRGRENDSIPKNTLWHARALRVEFPSAVLRDVLPDVPRPIPSRDEPFLPVDERPVPRNMNISQDILKTFGYTPGCAKCRKLSRNKYSHPGLAHSQDCRTKIEAASRTDSVYRDRAERAEQRKMDFYAKNRKELIIQREPHWNQVSHLDHQLQREIPRSDPGARGDPEQDSKCR